MLVLKDPVLMNQCKMPIFTPEILKIMLKIQAYSEFQVGKVDFLVSSLAGDGSCFLLTYYCYIFWDELVCE